MGKSDKVFKKKQPAETNCQYHKFFLQGVEAEYQVSPSNLNLSLTVLIIG